MSELNELTLAGLVARQAARNPDSETDVPACGPHRGRRRTYGQLWNRAQRLAAGMTRLGIEAGDRIALVLADEVEQEDAWVACSLLGAVIVVLDPKTESSELAERLTTTGCKGVITADHALAAVTQARDQVASLGWVAGIVTDHGRASSAQLQTCGVRPYAELAATDASGLRFGGSQPDATMRIVFPAGTPAGAPGIAITHRRHLERVAAAA
jgi:carnitine-CoA ligase